ncbi:hypothetical protein [Aquisphaera giovannonii]|uniref:hypothetical protein n=1 Tax=Aquisphaera giovannonii TaxID=406548 RepID=UPI001AEF64C8|nr:hypothetical protein [Aquisphaera giovannonii]
MPAEVEDGIDQLLQKSAAARLLAEMGPGTPIDAKVARLIDRLSLRDRVHTQAAATALIMLGRPAVPSIVRRMDDRRDVGILSFENRSPDAFEGVRHMGLPKVVDCLDEILSEITGEPVGSMAAGGREPGTARDERVAAWTEYLARMSPPVPAKSLPALRPAARPGR